MKKYYDDMFKEYSKDCKKNFASINSVLGRRRNLAKKFSDYLTEKTDENFVFANMTPDIINDALSKLKNKNSSGPDNISTNLLKSIMPSIMGLYICHFFNMSFKTGYIPTIFKTGKIVPVFKTGESDTFTNYRPISLLSSFSKLLEKVAGNKIMNYLNRLKL